jgi:hypothetical protein
MAHWAELDDNNKVVRITVGNNNDPNGDEGYQWLIENLGGRWLKCPYNTILGNHLLGGTPFRWTYPGVDSVYLEDLDIFTQPKPYESWILETKNYGWVPPVPKPDSGFWIWNEETVSWQEYEIE